MRSSFDEIPRRIFLDSSTLQTLQSYGGFIYENDPVPESDRIYINPLGVPNLEALRWIMRVAERAPFEFALSKNSLREVERRNDASYLQWAYDVLDHWLTCLEESWSDLQDAGRAVAIESPAYGYLGCGDRALLKDAMFLGCDAFLTMENRLPRNAEHLTRTLGIRVLSPVATWELLRPWAALFY